MECVWISWNSLRDEWCYALPKRLPNRFLQERKKVQCSNQRTDQVIRWHFHSVNLRTKFREKQPSAGEGSSISPPWWGQKRGYGGIFRRTIWYYSRWKTYDDDTRRSPSNTWSSNWLLTQIRGEFWFQVYDRNGILVSSPQFILTNGKRVM